MMSLRTQLIFRVILGTLLTTLVLASPESHGYQFSGNGRWFKLISQTGSQPQTISFCANENAGGLGISQIAEIRDATDLSTILNLLQTQGLFN